MSLLVLLRSILMADPLPVANHGREKLERGGLYAISPISGVYIEELPSGKHHRGEHRSRPLSVIPAWTDQQPGSDIQSRRLQRQFGGWRSTVT
jgi:hypothetical protein